MPASSAPALDALLATKLYIPALRPHRVPRPRLTERLEQGTAGPLTLISAPAGFGKSTLLSEWIHAGGRPVAWVSLDEGTTTSPASFSMPSPPCSGSIPASARRPSAPSGTSRLPAGRSSSPCSPAWSTRSMPSIPAPATSSSWFRHHHPFATLLRHQLERKLGPEGIKPLHERASDWYAAHGHQEDALEHALAAGAHDRAAELQEDDGAADGDLLRQPGGPRRPGPLRGRGRPHPGAGPPRPGGDRPRPRPAGRAAAAGRGRALGPRAGAAR